MKKQLNNIFSFFIFIFSFSTITVAQTQPPCGNNPLATDQIAGAPLICDLSGYCGNTSSTYTDWSWAALDAAFCGSIENNSFITFVATSSSVTFDTWVSSGSDGIQLMVFSTAGPNMPVTSYGCDNQLAPSPNMQQYTATGLTPGQTYYLMIDGFAGDVSDYLISASSGVQVSSITPSNPNVCLGSSVTLTAIGGDGTSTWDASPYLNSTTGTSVVVTPTQAGSYDFTVNLGGALSGCPSTATTTVTVYDMPFPNAGPDQTVCFGDVIQLNGIRGGATNTSLWSTILPTGMTPAATAQYAPNFTSQTPIVTVNQPGVYKFIFREQNAICGTIRDTVQITVGVASHTLTKTDVSCVGFSNGQIIVSNPEAVEFSIDNGTTWQASNTFSNLGEGTYNVCSKNAIGCEYCSSIDIVSPVSVNISISTDTLICENGSATISALSTDGTSFTYIWRHTNDLQGTQVVNPNSDTYYTVYAVNQNGCQSPKDSVFVQVRSGLAGTITPDFSICPGYPQAITVNATGGLGAPYQFSWSSGTSQQGSTSTIAPDPSQSTSYTVTITDGCESTPIQLVNTVSIFPLPIPSFTVDNTDKCEPAIFELTNTSDLSNSQQFYWTLPNGVVVQNESTVETVPLFDGAYSVQLVMTSTDGCIDSVTYVNYLHAHPLPTANFAYSPNPIQMFNTKVSFSNQSTQDIIYFDWSFENGSILYSTAENPVVTFPDGTVGNYAVQLIGTTEYGCKDTIVQQVVVLPEVILYAPNTFTPNGDEYNNTFNVFIEGVDLSSFHLRIYDRWGHVVFESQDTQIGWDGTLNGIILPDGAYVWTIKAKDAINDGVYEFNGTIQLIK